MFTTENSEAWLARAFAPIGLTELNAKAAMLERIDNKYVVRADVLAQAVAQLALRFDILEIDGKRSFIYETCYFDDADRHCYFDHHQGRRQRAKVRVRKYLDAGLCFVEVKLKDKRGITIKKRMRYALEKYGTLDAQAVAHVRQAYRDQYERDFEHALEPSLEMSYRRLTLVAKDGGERMTVDGGIRFHAGDEVRATEGDVFVVETKSASGNGIADKVLRSLHQHPTNACSKYCVGMSMTGAVRRHNRFLPALRKLGIAPDRGDASGLATAAGHTTDRVA
jgi:VTC domain